MDYTIALFGEAEKGEYSTPYFCKTLPELVKYFGNPPKDSYGLYFAVQAILFHSNLIFLRVQEEGYSTDDYLTGVNLLKEQKMIPNVTALCLPGVGTKSILNTIQDAIKPIYQFQNSILIMNESDLYDYMTDAII